MGKKKKKGIEISQPRQDTYVLDNDTIFTQRKKALMCRDTLTKELLKKLDEYRPNKSKPSEEEIETTRQKLADKWNVGIIITDAARPFVTGLPVIANQKRDNCLSPVKFTYNGIEIQEMEPLIIRNNIAGSPVWAFRPYCKGTLLEAKTNELVLHVNLDLLDKADAREVKLAIWSMIEKNLPKCKPNNKKNDLPELSFIYDIRQNTFDNYVQWYDWHINELLGFRIITFLDKEIKNGNTDVNGLIDKLKNKRFPIGTKKSYKGEDRIEKGVKLIYEAIHQKKYPTRKERHETFLEEYNCPTHSPNKCSISCKYQKKWYDKFQKLMSLKNISNKNIQYNDEQDYT
jgi:hypothetical protein